MHPRGHPVKISEARLNSCAGTLVIEVVFNRFDRQLDVILDGWVIGDAVLGLDIQHRLLHLANQTLHLARLLVRIGDRLGAGVNHLPQEPPIPDDFKVILEVRGRRHPVLQLGQIGHAPDVFQFPVATQLVRQRQQVDRGVPAAHLHHRNIDRLVAEVVKYRLVLHFLDEGVEVFPRIQQDAA